MKPQIEAAILILKSTDRQTLTEIYDEFDSILSAIFLSNNEKELRYHMGLGILDYFIFGFGSNHMWVKQLNSFGDPCKDRLLFVEFSN